MKSTVVFSLNIALYLVLVSHVMQINSQFQGETIKFKLSATNLPNSDLEFDGISDPYAVLFTSVKVGVNRHWEKFGQTAVKKDTLNPVWDDVFLYQYINGTDQRWRIFVIDKDRTWYNPIDDPLGAVEAKVDDYYYEIRNTRDNRDFKPVQLFLSRPMGGVLTVTPVPE